MALRVIWPSCQRATDFPHKDCGDALAHPTIASSQPRQVVGDPKQNSVMLPTTPPIRSVLGT